jgi:hypothetical protein
LSMRRLPVQETLIQVGIAFMPFNTTVLQTGASSYE